MPLQQKITVNQSFEIKFDFPVDDSGLAISLSAQVHPNDNEPFYLINDFHIIISGVVKDDSSALPPQEIKMIVRNSKCLWVHRDIERETLLSVAIGKEIEQKRSLQAPVFFVRSFDALSESSLTPQLQDY
ncbi:MAG TPA: hypothetical protein VGQ09_09410 [Chitinophagaceae bacterium]|nr:hypothetical protein [Chitinophagaceae bacterium]